MAFRAALGGATALAYAAFNLPSGQLPEVLFFFALCIVSQRMPVSLFRNSSISVTFAVAFAALVYLGPAAAIVAQVGAGLVLCVTPYVKPPKKMLFNAGSLPLQTGLAGAVYLALGGVVGPTYLSFTLVPPALVATVAFVAVNTLLLSLVIALTRGKLSSPRLALHLGLLVLVLHGTTPLAFPNPDYPWVYKHFGVVQHISLYGKVDERLDVYQNWPGFFALAAWFDAVAGVSGPIKYAAWAQVYFGLLFVLAMGFAIQALALPARLRWLALFIFSAVRSGEPLYIQRGYGAAAVLLGLVLVLFIVTRVLARNRQGSR